METGKAVAWHDATSHKIAPLNQEVSAHFRQVTVDEGECWLLLMLTHTRIPYPNMDWDTWDAVVKSIAETLDALREREMGIF